MRTVVGISLAVLACVWFAAAPAKAKNSNGKFKTVEAKHFDRAEGVELTPEFSDYLYAELRTRLEKTKMFGQVIGEGEVVEEADAPASVVLTGTLTEYKKGNAIESKIIGFGTGKRGLKVQVNVLRRSDQKNLKSLNIHVKALPNWNEKILAVEAAKQIANEVKDSLEHEGS